MGDDSHFNPPPDKKEQRLSALTAGVFSGLHEVPDQVVDFTIELIATIADGATIDDYIDGPVDLESDDTRLALEKRLTGIIRKAISYDRRLR